MLQHQLFKRVFQRITRRYYNVSYAQCGEDIIVEFFLQAKGITDFTYLDIGANHPTKLSNTYKFYEKGYRGVLIEPDATLYDQLKKIRPDDVCLHAGISDKDDETATLFVMNNPLLNTFSTSEAQAMVNSGQATLIREINVPVVRVRTVIEQYIDLSKALFVNLDVEGVDELILRDFPFSLCRPVLFCVETVGLSPDASAPKRNEIFDMMRNNGYEVFADTYVNTLFWDNQLIKRNLA